MDELAEKAFRAGWQAAHKYAHDVREGHSFDRADEALEKAITKHLRGKNNPPETLGSAFKKLKRVVVKVIDMIDSE